MPKTIPDLMCNIFLLAEHTEVMVTDINHVHFAFGQYHPLPTLLTVFMRICIEYA